MNYQQSYTVAAANLTGFASNVTGAAFTLTATTPNDVLAHQVTVRNDSVTDHSGKTVALVGTDANGEAITETLTGPTGSATVTSAKYFKTLASATPSATIGADTFDIGWAAAAHSPWVVLETSRLPFAVSVAVDIGGTINYDVQHTYDPTPTEDSVAWNHSTLAAKTADAYDGYTLPVAAVRVDVNSHTSGTFTVAVLQG